MLFAPEGRLEGIEPYSVCIVTPRTGGSTPACLVASRFRQNTNTAEPLHPLTIFWVVGVIGTTKPSYFNYFAVFGVIKTSKPLYLLSFSGFWGHQNHETIVFPRLFWFFRLSKPRNHCIS